GYWSVPSCVNSHCAAPGHVADWLRLWHRMVTRDIGHSRPRRTPLRSREMPLPRGPAAAATRAGILRPYEPINAAIRDRWRRYETNGAHRADPEPAARADQRRRGPRGPDPAGAGAGERARRRPSLPEARS